MHSLGYKKLKKMLLATLAATLYLPTIPVQAAPDLKGDTVSARTQSEETQGTGIEEDLAGNVLDVEGEDYNMIYGGGDEASEDPSSRNKIIFKGRRANGIFGGMSTTGNVSKNTISMSGGYVAGGIIGGVTYFPYDSEGSAGNVFGNEIEVSGGTVNFVSGGEVSYTYPNSGSFTLDTTQERFLKGGEVYNNKVTINDGIVANGIIGGSSIAGKVRDNTIEIKGGKVYGQIIGGEVRYPNDNSEVTDNVIKIYGSPDLSNAYLIGGLLGSEYTTSGGNTLNIYTTGVTAQNIQGFDYLNFYVPESHINNSGERMLTLTNGTTSLNLDKINIFAPGNVDLKQDDTINFIYNANGLDTSLSDSNSSADVVGNANYNGTITKGSTSVYDLNLQTSDDATSLMGTVNDYVGPTEIVPAIPKPVNIPTIVLPPTPYIPEILPYDRDDDGYFVDTNENVGGGENLGEDANGEENSNGDKVELKDVVRESRGLEIFMDIGAGHMKTKTGGGSHIVSNTQNYDLGAGKIVKNQSSKNYFAPLLEHHTGDYDSYLSNGKKGVGETKYTAAGFITRQMQNNGMYYEGSIRAGRAKNDFSTDDFELNGTPIHLSYSMSAPLYATHLRIGNFKRLSPSVVCDVYGIYAYARQNGMSSDLSTGEHVSFGAVHANRLKLGYKMTTRTSRISTVYTGLAYQYDSNSSSTARSADWEHTSAGASGSSGMIELGWQIKPRQDMPLMVDIYATGWVGYHKGATAMAKLRKTF